MKTLEEPVKTKGGKKLMSVYQVWLSKEIYWIKTYKTLLRYISEDYVDIFQPIVTGKKSGKRYFVSSDKITDFINKFETNKLTE